MDCAVVNDCDYDIDAVTVNVDTIWCSRFMCTQKLTRWPD